MIRDEGLSPLPYQESDNIKVLRVSVMRTFYITLSVSMMLIIGGFLVPPLGIIDGSVLTAVGLLLMFVVLAQVPTLIDAARNGKSIRLTKGDFTAEVSSNHELHE